MKKITVIILTHNEAIHIERAIKSIKSIDPEIYIIDSFSSDSTAERAHLLGATVIERKWKNYSDQFQWGLEQFSAGSDWIMRLDADEYLEPDLQAEIPYLLESAPPDFYGINIRLKVVFDGKWIKHGGFYPLTLLRIWRTGYGKIEQRWMDEHIVLPPGLKTITAHGHLVDNNLKGMTFWINKHNQYATREAIELLNQKYHILKQDRAVINMGDGQAKRKRIIKEKIYAKLPPVSRAFLYFCYRYFLRLGFLDGREGFTWHFLQGFWYRLLVDAKIHEIEKRSGGDIDKMREVIRLDHGIDLSA